MNEIPASGKFAQWKRPLAGGSISAGVMLFFSLPFIRDFSLPLYSGFMVARKFELFSPFTFQTYFWMSLLFWFASGWVIAHFVNENKKAILHWSILYLVTFATTYIPSIYSTFFFYVIVIFGILFYFKGKRIAIWVSVILAIVLTVLGPILLLMIGCLIAGPYCS